MENVLLIGADDVVRASHNMQAAADNIKSATNNMESIFFAHEQFLTQFINRLEDILKQRT